VVECTQGIRRQDQYSAMLLLEYDYSHPGVSKVGIFAATLYWMKRAV